MPNAKRADFTRCLREPYEPRTTNIREPDLSVGGGKHAFEPGELEDAARRLWWVHELELAALLADASQPTDEQPENRRVEERHPVEIDDHDVMMSAWSRARISGAEWASSSPASVSRLLPMARKG